MNAVKTVSPEQLYLLDFELTSFAAQRQVWIDGVLFKREKPRHCSALIYLNGCTGTYTDLSTGEQFYAPCKSLVYLPYGGTYSVLNIDSKLHTPDAYLVEFNIRIGDETASLSDMPFQITGFNPYSVEKIMRETVDCFESVPVSPALLKSKIYDLLYQVSRGELPEQNRLLRTLQPALDYMKRAPYETVSVEEYGKMCGLSGGGFRRLFKQHLGKSPREYLIDLRLNAAKTLLEESDMSVKNIAEFLNFESDAYFCRLFKTRTGLTPSEFRAGIPK